MKKTLVIILTLIGFLSFGQEKILVGIDNEVNLIDNNSTLIVKDFEFDNQVLKVWYNSNKQILKIVEIRNVDYGEIKSTVYMKDLKPIKTLESEGIYFFLPDSLSKIKGYDIDIKEEYTAISYILNWNKRERKLIVKGKPLNDKNTSSDLIKYDGIIRKAKKLISE